ncbi:methionine adenosyltransferase [bacterium]|nr:methionine adenosyltransferase [Bacteroidales bacterium]MBD5386059.1 methionine adenosyltransferase [bacterium]MDE6806233.1 methionine adenosyltransferase [Muribaculaceae bacterium]MDE7509009.1 methionine adenosyltransferase [Muribaculaceae bacterium]
MNYLFTSESVSEGHPDKVSDQISDALLDEFLALDPQSHVAIETLCTTGQVVVAGEVSSEAYIDVPSVTRNVINNIGYNRGAYRFDGDSLGILTAIHEQSGDIDRGVRRRENADEEADLQGAGDQGMMFGYAVDETENYMPLTLDLSHMILRELADIRREGKEMAYYRKGKLTTYLRPDAKSQVTVEYDDDHRPVRIHTIVVSTQHDDFIQPLNDSAEAHDRADKEMLDTIRRDVEQVLLPRVKAKLPAEIQALFDDKLTLHVNPTGKFVLGGPHADTGLTGRKIIVDTYGGRGAHGGGAFSGKDPSKVDRSAAYACRHIAKNLVAAGVAREVLVQVAYAIGVARPVSLFINTFGTAKVNMSDAEIAAKVEEIFDMRPKKIEERLKLRNPIYLETAAYGHMGRKPETVVKEFATYSKNPVKREVELFTWEKLDHTEAIREAFGL